MTFSGVSRIEICDLWKDFKKLVVGNEGISRQEYFSHSGFSCRRAKISKTREPRSYCTARSVRDSSVPPGRLRIEAST